MKIAGFLPRQIGPGSRPPCATAGFTLIEVMVASAVIVTLTIFLLGATDQAGQVFKNTSGKIEQFREARNAFESVTRRLSEATLNTYWDYNYRTEGGVKIPISYGRQSELRFRSGRMEGLATTAAVYRPTHGVFFQAPAGEVQEEEHRRLDQALCSWGYFLEIDSDEGLLPLPAQDRVKPRTRSRLYELRQPTEALAIYDPVAAKQNGWFADALNARAIRPARVLSENIIALILLPRLAQADELARGAKPALSPVYEYDSTLTSNAVPPIAPPDADINPRNQLPPVVQVVMVALDEESAARLADKYPDDPELGIRTVDLFKKAALLEDNPSTPTPGDGDLGELEKRLIAERANYRIFSTTVPIRGAKWSRSQTN